MKRVLMAAVLGSVMLAAGGVYAAAPEPVGISLLRIEMKKTLLQQDAAPKLTQLRQKKLQELQAAGKADEAADAEVDLIQAQTAESLGNLSLKELDIQLKEALKQMAQQQLSPAGAAGGMQHPAAPTQPGQPAQLNQPVSPDQSDVASPSEIAMLQLDLQKAKIQADAASKVADNRQKLFAARQGKQSDKLTDTEADMLAAQTNARLAGLEVEACQMRLDAANKSTAPRK